MIIWKCKYLFFSISKHGRVAIAAWPLFFFIFLQSVSVFISCAKKEVVTEVEMYEMAKKVEPDIELILPKTLNDGVKCSDYGPKCLGGKQAKLRSVVLTVVQFEDSEHAKITADALGQYYFKNWVFDDVTGEPVLEHFVKTAFNAEKGVIKNKSKK